jgi:aconitate hydratase
MAFDINVIKEVYQQMPGRIEKARQLVGRPLTLSEKILYSHLWDDNAAKAYERGITVYASWKKTSSSAYNGAL